MAEHSQLTVEAFARLNKAVGTEKGLRLAEELLRSLGLAGLSTPSQLLQFAEALIDRGGLCAAVGSSLKVTAVLRGAVAQSKVA